MLCFLILTKVVSLEVTKAGRQFHLEVLPGENVDELHCSVDVFSACLRYIKKGKLLWKERTAIPMQATLPASSMMESPMHGQEFQTLYQNRFRLIYRYVYSKVGNREEAEDLTSEIFLKAARGIDEERSRESMQQWLFYIARTTVADYWRGYYRHPKSSLEELVEVGWDVPDEESSFETNSVAADRVQRILQALPEQQREVLQCRFLLRLSIKATALKMGVSVANVKVLQYRALRRAATLE